jgi:hypothetical protein
LGAPLDLYVRRLPPDTGHFLSQRVRQAYDEFALPGRLIAFLSVVPLTIAALARRRLGALVAAELSLVALAERGRRRAGGRLYFPPSTSWFAPAWVLERGICMWLALGRRILMGGVPYGAGVIRRAASSRRRLRQRFSGVPADRSAP